MTSLYARDKNLFLAVGKYVRRQNENFLTQSFAALFNNAEHFRGEFISYVSERSGQRRKVDPSALFARTQSGKKITVGRIVVDLEILKVRPQPGFPTPPTLYVVEAKLSAQLSESQLRNYGDFLKKRAPEAQMVLLTRDGIDEKLTPYAPKGAVWLTWGEVAEICKASVRTPAVEAFMRKEFVEMLEESGISFVPSISAVGWKRITLFNDFSTSRKTELNHDTFSVIDTLIERMRVHADNAWGSLTADGYKRYARVYVMREKGESPYSVVCVGFYCQGKNAVYDRYLCLEIDCATRAMIVCAGWSLKKRHPQYDPKEYEKSLYEWTPNGTFKLFKSPLQDAVNDAHAILHRCLKQFRGSKYFQH